MIDSATPVADDAAAARRAPLTQRILCRLEQAAAVARAQYEDSQATIGWFVVDDLLPDAIARAIHASFPDPGTMRLKRSLAEHKYVAAQMNEHDPLLEDIVYAFQDPRVVALVADLCGIPALEPDENLYAGGISVMGEGHFLNPHLDNSHDAQRQRWRRLNLLYYVTPDWPQDGGGNLEVWPRWPDGEAITIHSRFNRLAVMATHRRSWHSVSPITAGGMRRCCVSNYFFTRQPPTDDETFHITTFRGRPGQPLRDALLQIDSGAKQMLARTTGGLIRNPHVYQRDVDK